MPKVTQEQFIQAVENASIGETNLQIASKLGITDVTFYKLRNKYADHIRESAFKFASSLAYEQIQNLRRNAKNGDTAAAKYILEVGERLGLERMLKRLQEEIDQFRESSIESLDYIELTSENTDDEE